VHQHGMRELLSSHERQPHITMTSSKNYALSQLKRLESLLIHDPLNESLLEAAFTSAVEAGEWLSAERHLSAGKMNGKNTISWTLREGHLLLSMKKIAQAEILFLSLKSQADQHHEFSLLIAHNLAHIYFSRGDYSSALRKLREVIPQKISDYDIGTSSNKFSAVSPSTWRLLLRTLHHTGDLSEALQIIEKLRPHENIFIEIASIASAIALDFNRADYAREWSSIAIGSDRPENSKIEAFVVRASLLLGHGDISESRIFANRALTASPSEGRAYSVLGFIEFSIENFPLAEDFFKKSLQCNLTHIGTLLGLGWTQLFRESLAPAIASFNSAIDLDRNFGESYGSLAVAHALKGNRDIAREIARRGLKLDSRSLSSSFALAVLDGEIKSRTDLLKFSKQLLQIHSIPPNNQTTHSY
jgi:tetratricopeptide (TPR) repeat protein